LPVYSRLRDSDIDRVLRIVREASSSLDVHGKSYQHA
jgi:hypothetical protein